LASNALKGIKDTAQHIHHSTQSTSMCGEYVSRYCFGLIWFMLLIKFPMWD